MSRPRTLFAFIAALAAALVLAACGGGGGGDEDPTEVLQATFSNQASIDSGAFDVSVEVSADGGDQAGTFKANLGGPFQGAEEGFPSFDIEADAEIDSESQEFSGSAGVTSTGGSAFVNFQGTDYEIPEQVFSEFTNRFNQLQKQTEGQASEQGGNFLSSIGIDPTNWLTDLSNEGNEDVEGTETIHISGTADTPKLVEDIKKIAENAPQAADQVTPQQLGQLDQLTDLIETADFDVFTGADDDILRKIEATVELNPPDGDGAPSKVSLNFALTLSEVNEPQEIEPPSDAEPLQGLLDTLGVDAGTLGGLGSALGGAGGSGSGGGGAAPSQDGGAPAAPSGETEAYLQCLQTASGEAALQECAALLQ